MESIDDITLAHSAVIDKVRPLSHEEVTARPDASAWTVLECLEHIFVTNLEVYRFVSSDQSGKPESDVDQLIPRDRMRMALHNRDQKYKAPEQIRPTGRFKTLQEAVDQLQRVSTRFREFLSKNPTLGLATWDHPFLGTMTKKDWLHFVVDHTERHTFQVDEILTRCRSGQ